MTHIFILDETKFNSDVSYYLVCPECGRKMHIITDPKLKRYEIERGDTSVTHEFIYADERGEQ
jgi:hypothetical protein